MCPLNDTIASKNRSCFVFLEKYVYIPLFYYWIMRLGQEEICIKHTTLLLPRLNKEWCVKADISVTPSRLTNDAAHVVNLQCNAYSWVFCYPCCIIEMIFTLFFPNTHTLIEFRIAKSFTVTSIHRQLQKVWLARLACEPCVLLLFCLDPTFRRRRFSLFNTSILEFPCTCSIRSSLAIAFTFRITIE
jgi:hypothetical protein